MDRASITDAVREALAVVDEELPLPDGPRNQSFGDLRELRKAAFEVILAALLRAAEVTPEDTGGRAWLKTTEASEMLHLNAKTLYKLEKRGALHPRRAPSGQRRWSAAEIEAYRLAPAAAPDPD